MQRRMTRILLGCSLLLLGTGVVQSQPALAKSTTKVTKVAHKAKSKKLSAKAKRQRAEKKAFTKAERTQIATYRRQVKGLTNSAKGMYAQKPSLKKTFRPGKLSATYTAATVNWINFYRSMYGLNQVTADTTWNADAQYGAAALAAANKGLSHGLVGIQRPSIVTSTDWQRAAIVTNASNLSEGVQAPRDVVDVYLNDASNEVSIVPGHREWLLGDISRVGVGQAKTYNDLKVIEDEWNEHQPQTVAFPKAGVFPAALVSDGAPWSVSYGTDCDDDAPKPTVQVYDRTARKTVRVSRVGISNVPYGWFGTTVYFVPKRSQVKANHAYTVTLKGIQGQADVTYTTKLFNL